MQPYLPIGRCQTRTIPVYQYIPCLFPYVHFSIAERWCSGFSLHHLQLVCSCCKHRGRQNNRDFKEVLVALWIWLGALSKTGHKVKLWAFENTENVGEALQIRFCCVGLISRAAGVTNSKLLWLHRMDSTEELWRTQPQLLWRVSLWGGALQSPENRRWLTSVNHPCFLVDITPSLHHVLIVFSPLFPRDQRGVHKREDTPCWTKK